MVQGYYTLQEAAQFLSISVDELKTMTQKGQIRSFQDRGTLRFRIQDIQEMARQRGGTSDPELPLGDAPPSGSRKSSASSSSGRRKSQLSPKTPPKQADAPPAPKSSVPPASGGRKSQSSPKTPPKQVDVSALLDFEADDDSVDLGADFLSPSSGPKSPGSPKSGKKPIPPPHESRGSDSDVRLVADGSDVTFSYPKDSDIKLADSDVKSTGDPARPKTNQQGSSSPASKRSSTVAPGSGAAPSSKTALSEGQPSSKTGLASKPPSSPRPGGPQPVDSGVRLVPMDSDSDVQILGSSDEVPIGDHLPTPYVDSNVRLDRVPLPPADSDEGNLLQTEEINLDEEILRLEERSKKETPTKMKAKSELKFPTTSPFELSDSDMKMPSELADDSGPKTPMQPKLSDADSSDFDLTPASGGDLLPDDSDFSVGVADDQEQVLHEAASEMSSESSGISLDNPVDAGISLEDSAEVQPDDGLDFDLSLEVEDTPKPSAAKAVDDSDSDFELQISDTPKPSASQPAEESESHFDLSLAPDYEAQTTGAGDESDIDLSLDVDAEGAQVPPEDSSEFELNLQSDEGGLAPASGSDSDSEFELTLDDSGNLPPLEIDDEATPQVKSKKKAGQDEEQDIFETDFEVPALEDSGEATVTDSDLESSDFDLALDDSELAVEEESGSQVVALDEEEDSETLVDSDGDVAVVDDLGVEEESSDFGDLDADVQEGQAEVEQDETQAEPSGKREVVVKEKLVEPAPWGVMPVLFMLPCAVIMFLVGILGYEMIQTTTTMRPPGPLTVAVAEMLGQNITLKRN